MSARRQKNIESTSGALRRALDQREVLLAKLVRNEARIRTLAKRNNRARKALFTEGDHDDPAVVGERPYRYEPIDVPDEPFDDPIPF